MRPRSLLAVAAATLIIGAGMDTSAAATPTTIRAAAPNGVTWVSAGDSYSAGEGVLGNQGACAQSPNAYGPLATRLLAAKGWTFASNVFTACTGHLAEDEFNPRPDAAPKTSLWKWGIDQGSPEKVDVITMSFGGNDVGFAKVIADCLSITPDSWASVVGAVATRSPIPVIADSVTGCDTSEADLRERIDNLLVPTAPAGSCRGGRVDSRVVGKLDYTCSLLLDDHGTPKSYSDDERGSIADFYVKVVNEHLTDQGALYIVNYQRMLAPAKEWPRWSAVMCNGVTRGDADRLGRLLET